MSGSSYISALAAASVLAVFLAACPGEPSVGCTPEATDPCIGPGGCAGTHVCSPTGTGYNVCVCGSGGTDATSAYALLDAAADASTGDAATGD